MALVGDLEGARAGHLVVVRHGQVVVRDQVAVQVVVQVRLGDLVPHRDRVRDVVHDGAGHCAFTATRQRPQ